jgi:hypothetical protein
MHRWDYAGRGFARIGGLGKTDVNGFLVVNPRWSPVGSKVRFPNLLKIFFELKKTSETSRTSETSLNFKDFNILSYT